MCALPSCVFYMHSDASSFASDSLYVHASSSSQIIAKMYDPLLCLEVAIHMRTLDHGLGRLSIIDIEDLQF